MRHETRDPLCRPVISCHEFSPAKEKVSDMRKIIQYSSAFKRKILEEIKNGKWESASEAARAYGMHKQVVYTWLDKYGYGHLKGRMYKVVTPQERDLVAELKAENKKLRDMLLDEIVAHRVDEAAMLVACRELGTTPEELKKKDGMK